MPVVSPTRDTSTDSPPTPVPSGQESIRKRRSACDACHKAKIRCSGGVTCSRCDKDNIECHYSYRSNLGKPKGSLNKKTIERLRAMNQQTPTMDTDDTIHAATRQTPIEVAQSDSGGYPVFSSEPALSSGPSHGSNSMNLDGSCVLDSTSSGFLDLSLLEGDMQHFDSPLCGLEDIGPMLTGIPTPHFHSTVRHMSQGFDDGPAEVGIAEDDGERPGASAISGSPGARSRHAQLPASLREFVFTPRDSESGSSVRSQATGSRNCAPPTRCACIPALAGQLCHLHAAAHSRPPARLDTMLKCTQLAAAAMSNFLQCQACAADIQGFFLASMILSLTLDLNMLVIHMSEKSRSEVQIRVGDYDVSGRLAGVMEKVLVGSKLENLKSILDTLEMKVDFLSSDTAHKDFLRYEVDRLKRGFQRIADQIGVPDQSWACTPGSR